MNTALAVALAEPAVDVRHVRLGIVSPMANELETCTQFVTQLLAACDGFAFQEVTFFAVLDQVSRDGTKAALEGMADGEARLQVVWAPENRCVVDAYVQGYRAALAAGCDWILEIDAGFSHDPSDAPKFFTQMAQGYDCVFGTRFGKGGGFRKTSLKRRLVSLGGTVLANAVLGTRLSDMTSGYELFSRATLEMVLERGIRSRAHFFQTEIKAFCHKLKCAEVPITYSNPSPSLSQSAVREAFRELGRLLRKRFAGEL